MAGWGVLGAASQRRDRLAQTHGIMATTSNPNDYVPPDMAAKRLELELLHQRDDMLHFPHLHLWMVFAGTMWRAVPDVHAEPRILQGILARPGIEERRQFQDFPREVDDIHPLDARLCGQRPRSRPGAITDEQHPARRGLQSEGPTPGRP